MNNKENGCFPKRRQKKNFGWTKKSQSKPDESHLPNLPNPRAPSPDYPSLGAQTPENAELREAIPTAFVYNTVASLSPFLKKPSVGKKFRIVSKNEMDIETAEKLADWIHGTTVILSHSEVPLESEQQCRAVVEDAMCVGNKMEFSLSSDSSLAIWEDSDLWMFPTFQTPSASPYSDEANSSQASEQLPPEESPKPIGTLSQSELFQMIHSWRYLGGKFQRMRRKFGDVWKNVYLTELRMTPLDENKMGLLEFVKEGEMLRISDDIDELGEIFVEVCRKNASEVTFGVAGFAHVDADLPLSRTTTYYLNYDDDEDGDCASVSTEDSILPGYPLEQNVDELCEKIGELKVQDICIKTWFAVPRNIVFIRLVVTSLKRKMVHFKKLNGLHVIIQSCVNEKEKILGVISKVMKDEMIILLKGVPKFGKPYQFDKSTTFTIHIDHSYESQLENLKDLPAEMENIRSQLTRPNSDLRFIRTWRKKDLEAETTKTFALFSCKNKIVNSIPMNTKVLLSKCWEWDGQLERKADFVFAIRVENDESTKKKELGPNLITFEIKKTRTMIKDAQDFEISRAFYYIDIDTSDQIATDPYYTLLDARCPGTTPREVASRSVPVGADLKFSITQFTPWRRAASVGSSQTTTQSTQSDKSSVEEKQVVQVEQRPLTKPPVAQIVDSKRYQQRGFVYLSELSSYEKSQPLVVIRYGFDDAGEKVAAAPLNLGKRLLLSDGPSPDDVRIVGTVYDTHGENVTLQIDDKASDISFLHTWNKNSQLQCFVEN